MAFIFQCSYALGYLLLNDRPEMWLGLFLTGCSPGGGASNVWTYVLGGSLDLSVTMTFISTLVSYLAFPLWIYALGRTIPLCEYFMLLYFSFFTFLKVKVK